MARHVRLPVVYVWASPTTLVGLLAGSLTVLSGGRAQIRSGAIEFHGGFSCWFLRRVARASAMTLGHVIIGGDAHCLERCRAHEQAHVRQAERWGIAFIPAYLLASLWSWARGDHYYLDNHFERDARKVSGSPW